MWSNRTKHNFYIEKHGEISSLPRFTYTCKYSCLSEEILGWVLYWLYLQHVHTQLMEIYCCLWFFLGVESFDVNLTEQKVTVKGNVKPEAVLQTVSKTGKKTSFWEAEAETKEAAAAVTATEWYFTWPIIQSWWVDLNMRNCVRCF